MLKIVIAPPPGVYESWEELTAPHDVRVVDTANRAEAQIPNRVSLPSIIPCGRVTGGAADAVQLVGCDDRDRRAPGQGHHGDDGVSLTVVTDHRPEGPRERERDDQHEIDLDQVGEGVGVLEGVRGVRVVETTTVGAQFLDGLLGGDGASGQALVPARDGGDVVDSVEVLNGTGSHQNDREDEGQRQQKAKHNACQVHPEIPDAIGLLPVEAPDQCGDDGDTHGGGDEVLYREARHLDQVPHRRLTGIRLPVGIGDEGCRSVERLIRGNRLHSQGQQEMVLQAQKRVQEQHRYGGEGKDAPQVDRPLLVGVAIHSACPVDQALNPPMVISGQDTGHVAAQRAKRET